MEKLARAAGTVSSIEPEVPVAIAKFAKLQQDGCEGTPLLVHYKSVKDAVVAVSKLHRQRIGPAKAKHALWARQVNGEGASVRCPAPLLPSHHSQLRVHAAGLSRIHLPYTGGVSGLRTPESVKAARAEWAGGRPSARPASLRRQAYTGGRATVLHACEAVLHACR